jgi:hypothetical protein
LINILKEYIKDENVVWILKNIIDSFETDKKLNDGLPLGNLTSQLYSNIYMNKFDQFVKHKLKVKHYIRYADDFVFLSYDKQFLESLIPTIRSFLLFDLHLTLHQNKIFIKTIASGVDFLGWILFMDHRVLRTSTKRRMLKALSENPRQDVQASYRGLIKHRDTYKISLALRMQ